MKTIPLKNSIFFVLLLIGGKSFGQFFASTDVYVSVSEVKSIVINQTQLNIELSFDNAEQMIMGQTITQPNHIEITSSTDYEIKIFASTDLENNQATIPADNVSITPQPGDIGYTDTSINYIPVPLSQQEQAIITSVQGGTRRSFDIIYTVGSLENYINYPSGVYSTTITYSIVGN